MYLALTGELSRFNCNFIKEDDRDILGVRIYDAYDYIVVGY